MQSVSGTWEPIKKPKEVVEKVDFLDEKVGIYFKKLGYGTDWDTSRRVNLVWNEIFFKDEMYLQIETRVTLAQFKEWLMASPDFQPDFMIASARKEKELQEFYESFFNFKTGKFKGEK